MKMKKFFSLLIEFIETAFISFFTVTIIFSLLFRISEVSGTSMEPTISSGDKFIMTSHYGSARQGDIVVIDANEAVIMDKSGSLVKRNGMNKTIVKRVIAVAGQTVDFDFARGIVYIDGKEFNEPYTTSETHLDEGAFTWNYPVTVPDGYVFVMGDNRINSLDSRSVELGFVSEKNIEGKALVRVYPLSSFGLLK